MELFYAYEVEGSVCRLDPDESAHCVKVLRHRAGDTVDIIDGLGTLYHCRLSLDSPKGAEAQIISKEADWGSHPYRLTIGCCPTKNNDRFEWFVEKATEIGVDRIVPLIGDHSERKVYKTERALRIALSATKQSLKARIPVIDEPVSVKGFIKEPPDHVGGDGGVRHVFSEPIGVLPIFRGGIPAVHTCQHRVRPALQGQVELVAEALALGAGPGKIFVREPGVQGAQPQPLHPAVVRQTDEVVQGGPVAQVLTVLRELYARQNDLPIALLD